MKIYVSLSNRLLDLSLKKLLLEAKEGYEVFAENDGDPHSFKPDVVLINFYSLRKGKHVGCCDDHSCILLIDTGLDENESLVAFLKFKVRGILSQNADSILLKKAIRAISNGEIWIDNKTVRSILALHSFFGLDKRKEFLLTPREEEILALVLQGQSNKEIAAQLFLCEQTVKSHLNKIFKKAGVSSRSKLIARFSLSRSTELKF